MDLYRLNENERRVLCRQQLESLEFWLRRFIHDTLTSAFGRDYLDAEINGQFLLKNEFRKNVKSRISQEPQRFARQVDATYLDDLIYLVCNPRLYNLYFRAALKQAYPDGCAEARTFLERLVYPRNSLSHANPISLRKAEQVVCYTNDIIDSLKEFYRVNNLEEEFNVPRMLKVSDSFGNVFHLVDDGSIGLNERKEFYLRVGDTLTIEVEVDPTFDESEYRLWWYGAHLNSSERRLVLKIEETMVSVHYQIMCKLVTNKSWHKYGTYDHKFLIVYRILPPI